MNNKNITPTPQQPVERKLTAQMPSFLVELDEAALSSLEALPSFQGLHLYGACSYEGGDE